MASGSWQVRIDVEGAKGTGRVAVPGPAPAPEVLGMQRSVALVLAPLGLLLVVGLVSIVGAGAREATLEAGREPGAADVRRGRDAMAATVLVLGCLLWLGNQWWNAEDGVYRRYVFKPLVLRPALGGSRLTLHLEDPGWLNRRTDDLVPDHDHLMHLYVVRRPEMERVWHLHPELHAGSDFVQELPRSEERR